MSRQNSQGVNPPRVAATSHMDCRGAEATEAEDCSLSRGRFPGSGWSSWSEQTSSYGSDSWPSSPRQGASQYGSPRGDYPDYGRESRGGWRSSSEADLTPRFSGMTMGDIMRVTVMKEMEKLNMTRHRPLDLSEKSNSNNKK